MLKTTPKNAAPSALAGHPVFRGFEMLGVAASDLARMCQVDEPLMENWRAGKTRLPGPWAILLTRMLATWVRNAGAAAAFDAPDGDAAGLGGSKLDGAQNWLELAQETNKDFGTDDAHEADKLAAERTQSGTAGNVA